MSFRARLLTSGALGGVSGIAYAVGMLAMLAMPARAQTGGGESPGFSAQDGFAPTEVALNWQPVRQISAPIDA